MTKYLRILCWVSLSITVLLTWRVKTRWGDRIDKIWFLAIFERMRPRITLSPPAVEPAEPPIPMRKRRINWEKRGQLVMSPYPKPVVVMMLETWKKAISKLLENPG